MNPRLLAAFSLALSLQLSLTAEPIVLDLWPGKPPGETKPLPPEADTTKPDGRLVAGRRVIRLGNVSMPQIAVYPAPKEKSDGTAVIVAPGGGHYVLAYDLEGTEVAEWLNSIGVTAVVLKYRVPAREKEKRWRAAVQDAQRAVSLVRANAKKWNLAPDRIGILGFSAGGETAGLTALFENRTYPATDTADTSSHRPDFAALIYPGGLVPRGDSALAEWVKVPKGAPPFFFAQAHDDRVTSLNSALLYLELKRAGVPAELHIYETGGHGYGLRRTDQPVTTWPARMEAWLRSGGFLK